MAVRPVRARVTAAVENIFDDGLRVHAVIERLAHELVVERLVGDIHHQEIHFQPFDLVDSHARKALQARHFMDRDGVDEIGLARLQCGEPRGVFSDFAKDNFFDRRFAAPIVVVAGEDQIAAALETDELVRTGADEVLYN